MTYLRNTQRIYSKRGENNEVSEQIIGREGARSDFLTTLSFNLWRAWWQFRPTSTPPLGVFA